VRGKNEGALNIIWGVEGLFFMDKMEIRCIMLQADYNPLFVDSALRERERKRANKKRREKILEDVIVLVL
jgi:hypothetical protein